MRLDLPGLEAFIAVAELGSFSRAAERLGVGQPALTRRLQRFERSVGTELLLRGARPIQLSPAGAKLLPEARETLAHLEKAVRAANSGPDHMHIRVGCLPGIAVRFVVPAVASFRRKWPQCHVTVYDVPILSALSEALDSGAIEFALTVIGAEPWNFDCVPLLDESISLVCPKSHPLAKTKSVSWKNLKGVPLITVGPVGLTRELVNATFEHERMQPNVSIDVTNVATALALVQAGCGLAIVNSAALADERWRDLIAVQLVNPRLCTRIGIITRRDWTPSRTARDFMDELSRLVRGRGEASSQPDMMPLRHANMHS
jgi:DNA-binding transcriptional LysR family regulator